MSKNRKQPARPPVAPAISTPEPAVPNAEPGRLPAFLREPGWLHLIVLAGLAIVLYAQTIGFSYSLDDPISTTKNRYVQQGISGIGTLMTHGFMYGENLDNSGAYRPLPLATFALEHELVGNSAAAGHFINVLLYALCAVLVYQMLRTWLRDYHFLFPFAAALLWVAHPIHTEVVASIKSRDELMSLAFLCLSVISIFSFADKNKPLQLAVGGFWFFLALLSKESAITFLAVIPLALYFFRNLTLKQIIIATIPLLLMAGLYMLMRANFLDSVSEGKHINAVDNTLSAAGSTAERLATAFTILLRYIWLLIFPHPLSYDYSFREIPIVGFTDPMALLALAVYTGLTAFALLKLRSKHILSFCILFFLATISIVSNLVVEIGATLGERFLFVPSIAFCIAVVCLLSKWLMPSGENFAQRIKPLAGIIVVLLVLYSAKTIARSQDWKGNDVLFASGVKTAPNSARTNFHYGYQLFRKAERKESQQEKDALYAEAAHYMGRAVEIFPDIRDAQRNLGLVSINLKRYPQAARALQHALRLDDTLLLANFYTGVAYAYQEKPDSAIFFFDRELRLNPNHALTHHYKGFLQNNLSDKEQDPAKRTSHLQQALVHLNRAIELDPKYAESYFQKGYVLGKLGDFQSAIQNLEQGYAIEPKNSQALLFLGIGYGILGQPEKAIGYLKECIAVEPTLADAYKNLAYALRDTGRYKEAAQYLEQGLQHNPNDEIMKALLQQMRAMGGV